MTLFHLFLVAVIQGLTEFLPVSSSGHLILLPHVTGYKDQGQLIDVAVHLGTLFAVVIYFWTDVQSAIFGLPRVLRGRIDTPGAKLGFLLLIATVPVVVIGLFLKVTGLSDALRSITVVGWAILIFGLLLYWVDQRAGETRASADWSTRDAIIMGLWQAVALIPGTSRSGITITGARALGYSRQDGAKIAMLMSIPTIVASAALLGAEAIADADLAALRYGAIAAVLAFAAALLALGLMMRLLRSLSFTPYVIYRVLLGLAVLAIAYS